MNNLFRILIISIILAPMCFAQYYHFSQGNGLISMCLMHAISNKTTDDPGTILKQQETGTGLNETTIVMVQVKRPEGLRVYKGTGFGNSIIGKKQAVNNAIWKSQNTPEDSTTQQQLKRFKGQ